SGAGGLCWLPGPQRVPRRRCHRERPVRRVGWDHSPGAAPHPPPASPRPQGRCRMTRLTYTQELVLSVLAGAEGPLTSAEVGWREGIEPVAAWRCLDRLARRGLVERTGVASDGGRC